MCVRMCVVCVRMCVVCVRMCGVCACVCAIVLPTGFVKFLHKARRDQILSLAREEKARDLRDTPACQLGFIQEAIQLSQRRMRVGRVHWHVLDIP